MGSECGANLCENEASHIVCRIHKDMQHLMHVVAEACCVPDIWAWV